MAMVKRQRRGIALADAAQRPVKARNQQMPSAAQNFAGLALTGRANEILNLVVTVP